jgi:hypothetical protein
MISGSAETILVPANTTVVLEPKAAIPYGLSAIAFTGCDWAVEYLESA